MLGITPFLLEKIFIFLKYKSPLPLLSLLRLSNFRRFSCTRRSRFEQAIIVDLMVIDLQEQTAWPLSREKLLRLDCSFKSWSG